MKLKLYYARKSGSLAVRILIHELDLSCEFIAVTQKTYMTENKENFLTINPKGRLPTLVTEDNMVLTESQVIQQYLADQYAAQHNMPDLLPPVNDFRRYRVLEWISFIRVDLHNLYLLLINLEVPKDLKKNYFQPMFIKKLEYSHKALENKQYLMGDVFTIADGYLFVILTWLKDLEINISDFPNLEKYFLLLKQRPSIALSLKEKNLIV